MHGNTSSLRYDVGVVRETIHRRLKAWQENDPDGYNAWFAPYGALREHNVYTLDEMDLLAPLFFLPYEQRHIEYRPYQNNSKRPAVRGCRQRPRAVASGSDGRRIAEQFRSLSEPDVLACVQNLLRHAPIHKRCSPALPSTRGWLERKKRRNTMSNTTRPLQVVDLPEAVEQRIAACNGITATTPLPLSSVASLLDMSRQGLFRYAKKGVVRPRRKGGRTFISVQEAYLQLLEQEKPRGPRRRYIADLEKQHKIGKLRKLS